MKSGLYHGQVFHRRLRPKDHRLAYKVLSFLIDLDEVGELDRRLTLFSRNRLNLFSFYDRDHGQKDGGDLPSYIRGVLKEAGFDANGQILLLCFPRMLGYVFNPLSVYYCHDADGRLEAILYEVTSTFRERHSYLIAVDNAAVEAGVIRQTADKRLHVSPFMEMEMRYHFRLTAPGEQLKLAIRQTDREGVMLFASLKGDYEPLSDRALRRSFWAYPFMTLKVIVGIHWEGLKLALKGLKLLKGPPAPKAPVTLVKSPKAPVTLVKSPKAPVTLVKSPGAVVKPPKVQ